MTPEDLDLVPTEDLIEALVRRHKVAVISLQKNAVHDENSLINTRRFEGDYFQAMGMAADMIRRIGERLDAVRELADDDDE